MLLINPLGLSLLYQTYQDIVSKSQLLVTEYVVSYKLDESQEVIKMIYLQNTDLFIN